MEDLRRAKFSLHQIIMGLVPYAVRRDFCGNG